MMYLNDLTSFTGIETNNLEIKARLNRENTEGWLKTICGFSNAEGGVLFLGVEDGSSKLIGYDKNAADKERNYFNNQINEHIFPRPSYHISFIPYKNNDRDLFIIRVDVEESPIKPITLKINNIPSIYMRREGFTNGATYEEIINMSIKSQGTQFDITDSDVDYDRSDFSKLLAFYCQHNGGKQLTDKVLASMGFFNSKRKLKNGALLFADSCDNPKTSISCSAFSGTTRGSSRIVTLNRFTGNLIDGIAFMMEFVKQRMNHSLVKMANGRVNINSYPERSLFEGIINAIAHRDYYLDGTQIQLDLFADRLELSSPGSFYQGEKLRKTFDLSNIISKRRNELICNILVQCNVMEAAGTGFDKIAQEYANADETHKPYIFSTSDHFTLVLPDMTYGPGVSDAAVFPEIAFSEVKNGTPYDRKVLSFCYRSAKSVSEIADILGISNSSYLRETILGNLTTQGYLVKQKMGRAYVYHTNHDEVSVF